MKKTLLTIWIAFLGIGIHAQKIQPICEVEGGYGKIKEHIYYQNYEDDAPKIDENGLYSNFKIGAKYKKFALVSTNHTYFKSKAQNLSSDGAKWKFSPYMAIYKIELMYTFKGITIGANHTCTHLIKSSTLPNSFKINSGSDHIYIKLKIR